MELYGEDAIKCGDTQPRHADDGESAHRKVSPKAGSVMQTKIKSEPTNARPTELLIAQLQKQTHGIVAPLRSREARWVLDCPDCHRDFTHTELCPDDETRQPDPFMGWPGPKPEFPEGGLALICPNCKKSFVYQRHELIFRTS